MSGATRLTYDEVQRLVDQAASFNLFVMPDSHTSGRPLHRDAKAGEIIGIESSETLHRFDIELDLPSMETGMRAVNRVSPPVGRLDFRWMIAPREFIARPDREPPPTALDTSCSQRFIMQTAFSFGDGRNGFRAFGAGRTFPIMVKGKSQLAAAAVGVFTEGSGQLQGSEGNFTLCGQLSPDGTFLGHIMVRILDPSGALRAAGDLPPLEPIPDPDPSTTFLTWIAQKGKTPDQENSFSLTPDGQVRGFNIPVNLKRVEVSFSPGGTHGLTALDLRTGEIIGREIGFGKESVPRTAVNGTPLTPFQFEGVSRYTFYDSQGHAVGAFTANVIEGRSMQVTLPDAPDQPGLRFGYFGPIIQGFGCFKGVQGFLYGAAGSVLAPPPADHVISNMYVVRISDPEGRFRVAVLDRKMSAPGSVPEPEPPARAYFKRLVKKLDEHTEDYKRWRAGFRKCAGPLSKAIASKYAELLNVGDFPGLEIDADKLKEIFQASTKPYDPDTFNRYGGPAKGTFKFYDWKSHKETGSSVLYSYWDYKVLMSGDRYYKQITGSNLGYFEPDKTPDLNEKKVDIITNSVRQDVGMCSYVDIYQHGRQLRTSFAYRLPHRQEVLWFVKDLYKDGKDVHDNIFMASHEWKGTYNGQVAYFMVGIFFNIDLETCSIEVDGDQFWRALYEEEPAGKQLRAGE